MTRSGLLRSVARGTVAGSLLVGVSACVSATSTVIALTGIAAQQERGIDGRLSDLRTSGAVRGVLYDHNHEFARDLGITVYDGHVVITGAVRSEQERATVKHLAQTAAGVSGVTNATIVTDPETLDPLRDTVISTKLESRMLLDQDVDAVNFTVATVDRTVYVMGIARDRHELSRIVAHARDLEHVRRIVPLVTFKADRDAGETRLAGS